MPKSELRSYDDYQYSAIGKEKESSGSLSPFTYLCTILIIALLGLTVLYSASYPKAVSLDLPHYHYFFSNLIAGFSGLAAGSILRLVPAKSLRKGWIILIPAAIISLILSIVPSFHDGAYLTISGTRLLIPSSFAMLALPFAVASLYDEDHSKGFVLTIAVSALVMLLSLFSGGAGWYFMLCIELAILLRVRGAGIARTIAVFAFSILLGIAIICFLPEHLMAPIAYSIMPVRDASLYDPQLIAAASAISEGGIAGVGLGNGAYKLGALAEPEGSLIFSSFAEELGYMGALALLLLLLLVAILGSRAVSRARRRSDASTGVLVAGFTLFIVLRSLFSIGNACGLIPFPGILLPFFSYGPADEFMTVLSATVLYRLIYLLGRAHEKR